jgi:non-specific serine/threonine protein kinase/serine/threonine-protein kinase
MEIGGAPAKRPRGRDEMSSDDFGRVKRILVEALELPEEHRAEYLDQACGEDEALRGEVESLLEAASNAEGFLDTPAVARASELHDETCAREGSVIGPYLILRPLGEGGMGTVFLAEQQEPVRRHVALKLVKPGLDTKEVLARFEAERQTLAILKHPSVAKVLDGGATPLGRPYFVMEFVEGLPITEHCDRYRLSVSERLELFIRVCDAVQHAHSKGIIHRDLKPTNILVERHDGQSDPKVIDFGIAKALDPSATPGAMTTELGQVVGTPEYMSPEQGDRAVSDIDTRSDIYSLGVVLYELLTGVLPHPSERLRKASPAELDRLLRTHRVQRPSARVSSFVSGKTHRAEQRELLKGRAETFRTLSRDLRRDLDWIVMRCLEHDRDRRYTTANGLAMDLRRYQNDEAVAAGPPSASYRIRKYVARHRGVVAASAAVLLTLIAATVISLRFAVVAGKAREAEQARAVQLEAVAEFQQAQLRDLDPHALGGRLRGRLLESVPAAERQMLAEKVEGVSFAGLVITLLEDGILTPSLEAIRERFDEEPRVRGRLLQSVAGVADDLGLVEMAEEAQRESVALRRRKLGPSHPETLAAMSSLGTVLIARGQAEEAERILRKAAPGLEEQLGADDPRTLDARTALAVSLRRQGRLEEALGIYREVIAALERTRGPEHPETLNVLGNLGVALDQAQKLDEAERVLRGVVEASGRVLGEEHRRTLTAKVNLGAVLEGRGEFADAEMLYDEAHAKFHEILGPLHPRTLAVRSNLGWSIRRQGRLEEAQRHTFAAYEGRRKILGASHPDTLVSLGNLTVLLEKRGHLEEAERYAREALRIARSALGERHPRTTLAMNNLAIQLQRKGQLEEAEPLLRDALVARRGALGEEHPHTLISMNNLANLLQARGKLSEAETLFRKALDGRRKALGEEHMDTLGGMHNLARVLERQGELDEAARLIGEAVDVGRSILPENHWYLGVFLTRQASILADAGRLDSAHEAGNQAYTILDQALGSDHGRTRAASEQMAAICRALHDRRPGEGYARRAEEWARRAR